MLIERSDEIGLAPPAAGGIDPDALAAIQRITSGNFRLVARLLSQVGQILALNGMDLITRAAVEAARESLAIGTV